MSSVPCSVSGSELSSNLATSPSPSLNNSLTAICGLSSSYESRFISSTYPRISGIYGSTPYSDSSNYMSAFAAAAAAGPTSLYPSLGPPPPYDIKEPAASNWTPIPPTTCYSYDGGLYNSYGDRYGAMESAARRKNATRETTNTLKAWLHEHRKNPYPTKGEKIMLAIITKMTLTQVSTWFANARRRLKKENKMTWEPRSKSNENQDLDDKESFNGSDEISGSLDNCDDSKQKIRRIDEAGNDDHLANGLENNGKNSLDLLSVSNNEDKANESKSGIPNTVHHQQQQQHHQHQHQSSSLLSGQQQHIKQVLTEVDIRSARPHETSHLAPHLTNSQDNLRPKIWSLAQTATSQSPPYRNSQNSTTIHEWQLNECSTSPGSSDTMISSHANNSSEYQASPTQQQSGQQRHTNQEIQRGVSENRINVNSSNPGYHIPNHRVSSSNWPESCIYQMRTGSATAAVTTNGLTLSPTCPGGLVVGDNNRSVLSDKLKKDNHQSKVITSHHLPTSSTGFTSSFTAASAAAVAAAAAAAAVASATTVSGSGNGPPPPSSIAHLTHSSNENYSPYSIHPNDTETPLQAMRNAASNIGCTLDPSSERTHHHHHHGLTAPSSSASPPLSHGCGGVSVGMTSESHPMHFHNFTDNFLKQRSNTFLGKVFSDYVSTASTPHGIEIQPNELPSYPGDDGSTGTTPSPNPKDFPSEHHKRLLPPNTTFQSCGLIYGN